MAIRYLKKALASVITFTLALTIVIPSLFLSNIPLAKATTYTVTSIADNGVNTLRQAIIDANANAGTDTINITASGTISLLTTMDSITSDLTIDGAGAAAPGITLGGSSSIDCMVFASGSSGTIKGVNFNGCRKAIMTQVGSTSVNIGGTANGGEIIRIDGSTTAGISIEGGTTINVKNALIGNVSANSYGIDISDGTTIAIGGTATALDANTVIRSTNSGIRVGASTGVTINANLIGATAQGSSAVANGGSGIEVTSSSATSLTIGGTTSSDVNYINGNGAYGIKLTSGGATSVTIKSNYIGVSATGFVVANGSEGIYVGTANNTIGAATAANVISGNTLSGIIVTGAGATGNSIVGNYIGVDGTGNTAKGNSVNGILIDTSAAETTITGNVISGNTSSGINIASTATGTTYIYGNTIGLGVDADTAIGNGAHGIFASAKTIIGSASDSSQRNIITSNTQHGISFSGSVASLSTVYGNIIGIITNGTQRPNLGSGINLEGGVSGVTIGSDTASVGQQISANEQSGIVIDGASTDGIIVYKTDLNGNGLAPITTTNSAQNSTSLSLGITTLNTSGGSGTSSVYPGIMTVFSGTGSNATWAGTGIINSDGTWDLGAPLATGTNYWLYSNDNTRISASSATGTTTTDNTAPAAIGVTSSTGIVTSASYTLTGTKDKYTSVVNAESTLVSAGDVQTTWNTSTSLVEGVNTFTLDSRDYSANVSSTGTFTVTLDTVAPVAPQLSYNSNYSGATSTLTGTGEASSLIYVNGTYVVTAGVDGTFSTVLSVPTLYNNIYNIYAMDAAGYSSTTVTIAIGAPGSGGSSSGGSSSSSSGSSASIGTTQNSTGQSMAGEQETAPVPVKSTEDKTKETISNNTKDEVLGSKAIQTPPPPPLAPEPVKPLPQAAPKASEINYYEPVKAPIETAPVQAPEVIPEGAPSIINFNKEEFKPAFDQEILDSKFMGQTGEDKIPDWWKEENFGTDNLSVNQTQDTDSDGVSDSQEFLYGSDPKSADSDEDGITDAEEIEDKVNPANYDSDGDGIADGDEKAGQILKFNSTVVEEKVIAKYIKENNIVLNESTGETLAVIDSDGDGISDEQELALHTEPTIADSDSDGLSDGQEVLIFNTNPVKASKVSGIGISNVKLGQRNSVGPQYIMGGSDSPETEIEIHATDANGNDITIAKTKTDSNGSYSVLTKDLPSGNYTLNTVAVKGGKTVAVSYPVDLKVTEEVKVAAPTIEIKTENNQISIEGFTSEKTKLVAIWRSLVLSNTIVADQNFNISAPKGLEAGEHTATVYAVNTETGEQSSPVQVQFTVTTTGFASGQTNGISPLITIGGSTLILLSLIALAIYRRRKNQP